MGESVQAERGRKLVRRLSGFGEGSILALRQEDQYLGANIQGPVLIRGFVDFALQSRWLVLGAVVVLTAWGILSFRALTSTVVLL